MKKRGYLVAVSIKNDGAAFPSGRDLLLDSRLGPDLRDGVAVMRTISPRAHAPRENAIIVDPFFAGVVSGTSQALAAREQRGCEW